MRYATGIALGLTMFLLSAARMAVGDEPPLTYLQLDQRLHYSDLVCSATILDTWRTGETLGVNSSVTPENLARADVDSVFKGRLTTTTITFRWYTWPGPGDPNVGPGGYAYSGPPLAELRTGTRYLLFLRGDGMTGWRVTVPMYQPEIPLAPQPAMNLRLRLDASGLAVAERNRELAEEFAAAAHFVELQGDAANVYDYFSWTAELLGKQGVPLIRSFLESDNPRIRYFAADRLAQMNDSTGRDVLLVILRGQSLGPWMRANAAWDLGKLHATGALPHLEKFATEDPEAAVREGALRDLGELTDPSSAGLLVRVLDDPARIIAFLPQAFWRRSYTGKSTPGIS